MLFRSKRRTAGTYVYALTCAGGGGNASASATLTVTNAGSSAAVTEAISAGLPTDVTPILSIAGVWQPVASQYLRAGADNGSLANEFLANIRLANGKEGLVGLSHLSGDYGAVGLAKRVTRSYMKSTASSKLLTRMRSLRPWARTSSSSPKMPLTP